MKCRVSIVRHGCDARSVNWPRAGEDARTMSSSSAERDRVTRASGEWSGLVPWNALQTETTPHCIDLALHVGIHVDDLGPWPVESFFRPFLRTVETHLRSECRRTCRV